MAHKEVAEEDLKDVDFSTIGPKLRAVEFYAGIGGFHYALLESKCEAEVVASIDINTNTNTVYAHNFPNHSLLHLNRNICGMTAEELDSFKPDAFFLSPPCQPFTRQGLRRDTADRRTDSFFHLMHLLQEMSDPPSYILMENVQGFESSQTRDHFVGILESLDYHVQEFLLSPVQFGIPNSRLRFYLLAKKRSLQFGLKIAPVERGKPSEEAERLMEFVRSIPVSLKGQCDSISSSPHPTSTISTYLDPLSEEQLADYLVPDKILEKYAIAMDIVHPSSNHSCCFTKSYGSYALGTGSILQHSLQAEDLTKAFERYSHHQECGDVGSAVKDLRGLNLRYFTPREVASLMCFPEEFSFPSCLTRKQCYKVLGNSLNVYVVTILMKYLFHD